MYLTVERMGSLSEKNTQTYTKFTDKYILFIH